MKGYGGRILHVDATSGRSREEAVGEASARSLLGGNGFAARLLVDQVPPGIDAYDAANAVVFAVGFKKADRPAKTLPVIVVGVPAVHVWNAQSPPSPTQT